MGRPRRHQAAVAICLGLMLWAGTAQAQPAATGPLGLDEAVRAAARWHPSVRNTAQQLLQANEGIAVARSGYLPQVRTGIGAQFGNNNIASYDSRRVQTGTLGVSQVLYDFGKVASLVDEAEAATRATRAQAQQSIDDIARDTAQSWVEVHRQEALSRIARDQLDGVQALTELVMERERKGAGTRSDVAQAQARVEAARVQVLGADALASRARLNLKNLVGSPGADGIAGDPPAWLAQACSPGAAAPATPAVRLADARREEADAQVRGARARRLPTLSLDGTASRALSGRSHLANGSGTNTVVALNFSMPLYEGGGGDARERAAGYALGAADAALEQARQAARQSLDDAQSLAHSYTRRDPALAARVESIHTTRDLYLQQYLQLGTRSLLDLLNSEQEYHAARFEQAESLHEQYRLGTLCLYNTDRLRSAFGLEEAQDASATTGWSAR
jgi:adhesin transport system outer membrane protein